ncbi:DUF2982 domain-containing protein [Pseudoalteromonas sp. McH1-7]|uniref:DUF2982 domain-containing protein n=1 Tax=Pseudoalteromonas peptidolytica F12-50-A1 TaxID=1315280 RepID=A0A8I0T4C2_9GAMM|nr:MULTISPECIES: DUF2982 domain-containing protein [Pseudoalteromonas]MBE0345064.1 hypothetical protein [Pseudoalteromonas peptidolytica F12-50-A1]MDW7550345.1 DUF2982 domain-containing protein [Pseudoalteromonas peptidolytica]NLR14935.1 DUF2982 domain-containing protein [Pseudoalteromonas peptidolytica]NUZ10749.1 DUF2982 domain-containing protein [Pseudoalteromonas sp. McH1-7]RRS08944.1 DUF2982 domain-containing protein [Pseudoalteromonas sp. J010]
MLEAKLRATANRHGAEFMLVGAIGLVVIMLFVNLRGTPISIIEIFLASAMLVAIFIGFLKSQQPYFSLCFNEQEFSYVHKYGAWSLPIVNFHSSGIPSVQQGIETLELNTVGIKLNDIDAFLINLTPRLAGKLLIEQRHIFLQAVKIHCENGNCPSEWLIEDTSYRSKAGKEYTGLMAMFANRMDNLKTVTGYDLLLPATALDRDIWQFSAMLNRWKLNPKEVVNALLEEHTTH